MLAIVASVGVLAFAGGFLLANLTDASAPTPTVSASSPAAPSPSTAASGEPSASPSDGPSPTGSPVPAAPLEDGRHFGMVTGAATRADGGGLVMFDVATFLTGEDANQAADADGVQTPVPNDYYIVDDSPEPLRLPIADDAEIRYVPEGNCCEPRSGTTQAFIAAAGGVEGEDYPPMGLTYWWVTVEGGLVVAVEQQFLP